MTEVIEGQVVDSDEQGRIQLMVTLSAEYVTVLEKIETAKADQKRDVLRDLSNTGLAILAGALTLITVGSQFIKTPNALYVGMSIVAVSVVLAFGIRIRIGRRFTKLIDQQYNDYTSRAVAARGMLYTNDKQRAQYDLDRVIKEVPFKSNPISRLLNASDIIIGFILLIGALITTIGVIFQITIK